MTNDPNSLPVHEYLVHPHTGLPLQAVGVRRNGTPIWPIMGASEGDEGGDGTGAGETSAGDGSGSPKDDSGDTDGAEHLGDKGKQALDRMKAEKKAAQDEARTAKEQAKSNADALAALQAKIDGKEAEHAAELKSREVETAALAKANERILKAEVRAAAAGKLTDPADALQFLDLSKLEVGSDGEVDSTAVAAAIDKLITDKPYLAAQGKRFQGSADGGTRNESTKTIDDQIEAARKAGNHILAIALKQKRSAELASK
jgi:hypothetical protein